MGSGGSRLTTGTSDYHVALERDLAGFIGAPAALVFGSGYHANMGVIPALAAAARDCGERLSIFSDADNHARLTSQDDFLALNREVSMIVGSSRR